MGLGLSCRGGIPLVEQHAFGCVVLLGFDFLLCVDGPWFLRFVCGFGGCHMTLMESLILAQDERWRRA